MDDERIYLTEEQALSLLSKSKLIHTFRSGTGILMGCDWRRTELVKLIKSCKIEVGGDMCRKMGHGLVIWTSDSDPLFVEVDDKKLSKLLI